MSPSLLVLCLFVSQNLFFEPLASLKVTSLGFLGWFSLYLLFTFSPFHAVAQDGLEPRVILLS